MLKKVNEPKTGNIKVEHIQLGATENPSTLELYNTFQEEEREWRRKQEERRRREEEAAGFKSPGTNQIWH